jgi:hypothetical protein
MRYFVLFTLLIMGLSACKKQALPTPPGMEHDPVWTGNDGALVNTKSASGKTYQSKTTIIPLVKAPIGQVASVHTALRFVILDFPLHPMPQVDQRLFIYRKNQKVGEVKVTGPAHGRTIAADIVAGEALAEDEVRPE